MKPNICKQEYVYSMFNILYAKTDESAEKICTDKLSFDFHLVYTLIDTLIQSTVYLIFLFIQIYECIVNIFDHEILIGCLIWQKLFIYYILV